jgi:GNAT superfamily N-acetyltransferase
MSGPQFAIVFSPDCSREVSKYVVRGFFGLHELPQALTRMILTAEFALFVGVPLVFLLVAYWFPMAWPYAEAVSPGLTGVAVAWLIAGLLRISRYGPSSGIGCYVIEPNGHRGALVGGLRMRWERRRRCLWLAGLLVEPKYRGGGIGTALMLGAFRVAQQEALQGPVTVSVFAPSHPASKAIVERHVGGRQSMRVSVPPSEELLRVLGDLEGALGRSVGNFAWQLSSAGESLL